VRLRFTGSAGNQKMVENATIDTAHQPVRMAMALLFLHVYYRFSADFLMTFQIL
jgi:hypothetical protein